MINKFSYFTNNVKITNCKPAKNISYEDIAVGLCSDIWRKQVEKVICFKYGSKEYSAAKTEHLHYFTPHGIFKVRNNESIIEHSNLLMFDVDLKDNKGLNIKNLRTKIESRPDIALAFNSISGGYKFLVYKNCTPENHINTYNSVLKYFENKYNINLDERQGTLSQPCFISYDKEVFVNYECIEFSLQNEIYQFIKNYIAKFTDGEKWHKLGIISYLAGGFFSGGLVDEKTTLKLIADEIAKHEINDFSIAEKQIRNSFAAGQTKPVKSFQNAENKADEMYEKKYVIDKDLIPKSKSFPVEIFPLAIQKIIYEVKDKLNFPIDFFAASVLWSYSSAIGNNVKLKVKNSWIESTCMYIALVGKTGINKSHPLDFAIRPLNTYDKSKYEIYKNELEQYNLSIENDLPEKPKKPKQEQIVVMDTTQEALAQVHEFNKKGIAIVRDELAGWLKDFDKYRGKGSDEQFFLSAWNNKPIKINRKTTDNIMIEDTFINVIGTIQPKILSEILSKSMSENGFIDRLLFVYPDNLKIEDFNDSDLDMIYIDSYLNHLNEALDLRHSDQIILKLTADAKELYKKYTSDYNRKLNNDNYNNVERGIIIKSNHYVLRFALIVQLMYEVTDISLKSMESAIKLSEFFKSNALKACAVIDQTKEINEVSKKLNGNTKDEKLIELRKKGFAWRKIGEELNISKDTARNRYNEITGDK